MLPVMSEVQDQRVKVKNLIKQAIKISSYCLMPLMVGLAVCAQPMVRLLLTEKWLDCVFFIRIFCFSYAFYPIQTANLNAINALGRTDIYLKLEIIKKSLTFVSLFATAFISVKALAIGGLICSVLSQIINAFPNKKLVDYGYFNQLKDIFPNILLSTFMGFVVYCVNFFGLSDILTLAIQIPLGAIVYIVCSIIFKIDSFYFIKDCLRQYVHF